MRVFFQLFINGWINDLMACIEGDLSRSSHAGKHQSEALISQKFINSVRHAQVLSLQDSQLSAVFIIITTDLNSVSE